MVNTHTHTQTYGIKLLNVQFSSISYIHNIVQPSPLFPNLFHHNNLLYFKMHLSLESPGATLPPSTLVQPLICHSSLRLNSNSCSQSPVGSRDLGSVASGPTVCPSLVSVGLAAPLGSPWVQFWPCVPSSMVAGTGLHWRGGKAGGWHSERVPGLGRAQYQEGEILK